MTDAKRYQQNEHTVDVQTLRNPKRLSIDDDANNIGPRAATASSNITDIDASRNPNTRRSPDTPSVGLEARSREQNRIEILSFLFLAQRCCCVAKVQCLV